MTSDYKKYSLEKLQQWVHDAMNSDASPHEIYSAIREAVREEYYYHKDCISRASGLLELLSGHRPVKDESEVNKWDAWEEHYYPEEYKKTTENVDLDKEIEEIRKEGGYDWTPEVKRDKVKKWVLPVEECKDADTDETEYFVSFPDDLLEAANLKEGDQVEWMDQGDGSYLIEKVPMTYDEMIAAGWTMTADGFWIKE
jgi:hypothetical protein